MRPLEIGICGCGPGGLALALFLHRAGHKVRFIERFAEPRPVGSGLLLQPTGLEVLRRLELKEAMITRGQRIDRLFGKSVPSDRVVLEVSYAALGNGVTGLAVHRSALFGVLFEAVAAAGLPIETNRTVTGIDRHSGGRLSVVAERGRPIGPFDLVVDALGSRSPIAAAEFGVKHRPLPWGALWGTLPWPTSGFDPHALEQRYLRSSVMIGVLPVGRPSPGEAPQTCFFWSLKPAEHDAWRTRGLDAWKSEVAALWPPTQLLLDQVTDLDQLSLARYGQHTLSEPCADRLAVIGDAAHSTSPQLGQGANMALIDSLALSSALEKEDEIEEALLTYAWLRRRHVQLYQAMSLLFTPFYQSDSRVMPLLRDNLFAIASSLPGSGRLLASLVAGMWGRPLRRMPDS